jgi:Clp amino terminal domain, pathogenicity island component
VVVAANEEARLQGHDYIGPEHILLGLLQERQGLAARTLERRGITLDQARAQVIRIVGPGEKESMGRQIPFTQPAKEIVKVANTLAENEVGTEHILFALLRRNRPGDPGPLAISGGWGCPGTPTRVRVSILEGVREPPTEGTPGLRRFQGGGVATGTTLASSASSSSRFQGGHARK